MKDVQVSTPTLEFSDFRKILVLPGIKERNKSFDVIFVRKTVLCSFCTPDIFPLKFRIFFSEFQN